MKKKRLLKIFLILYHLVTLVVLLGLSPKDLFYWKNNIIILVFTLPISFISYAYRYGQAEPIYPVIIIQAVMFIITWLVFITLPNRKK